MEKEREIKQTPQLEKGYIQIATGKEENDILMALVRANLSSTEYQIILLVLRKTWGWKKKEDWITLTQFENYTSKSRAIICRTIKKLVNKNILVKKSTPGKGALYGFNKDFNQWKQLVYKSRLVYKSTPTSIQKYTQLVYKSILPSTKETITKETNTKDSIPPLTTNQTPIYKTKDYLKKIIEDKEFCFKERKEHFSQKNAINATIVEIQREAEKSLNWLEANGKVKKNYRAFLHNWLIKSFGYKFRQ